MYVDVARNTCLDPTHLVLGHVLAIFDGPPGFGEAAAAAAWFSLTVHGQ